LLELRRDHVTDPRHLREPRLCLLELCEVGLIQRTVSEEYLTIAEVAARLKIKPKTVKNKMASGLFRKGIHYFSPQGLGPRFKWSAVVAWLEQSLPVTESDDSIPMARGYQLGKSNGGIDTGR
jgi:hypothetical protein